MEVIEFLAEVFIYVTIICVFGTLILLGVKLWGVELEWIWVGRAFGTSVFSFISFGILAMIADA
jgi:hypothetical protein